MEAELARVNEENRVYRYMYEDAEVVNGMGMGVWTEPCEWCGISTYAGVVADAYDYHESEMNRVHCNECRTDHIYCRDCRARTHTCEIELYHRHAGMCVHCDPVRL
jgi:hypothetical protein